MVSEQDWSGETDEGGESVVIKTSTKPKTLSEQWDAWREAHGIPEPILEMYRRHGDKPGYKCGECENRSKTHGGCWEHGGAIWFDPNWTACGVYDGPEPAKPKNDNQEVML